MPCLKHWAPHFSLTCTYFPPPAFFIIDVHSTSNNNLATDSIFYSLEISYSKEIDLLQFNLSSGKLSGHGQKAARFLFKIQWTYDLSHLLLKIPLHSENSWFRPGQSVIFSASHCSRLKLVVLLSSTSAFNHFCCHCYFVQSSKDLHIPPKHNIARSTTAKTHSLVLISVLTAFLLLW